MQTRQGSRCGDAHNKPYSLLHHESHSQLTLLLSLPSQTLISLHLSSTCPHLSLNSVSSVPSLILSFLHLSSPCPQFRPCSGTLTCCGVFGENSSREVTPAILYKSRGLNPHYSVGLLSKRVLKNILMCRPCYEFKSQTVIHGIVKSSSSLFHLKENMGAARE